MTQSDGCLLILLGFMGLSFFLGLAIYGGIAYGIWALALSI